MSASPCSHLVITESSEVPYCTGNANPTAPVVEKRITNEAPVVGKQNTEITTLRPNLYNLCVVSGTLVNLYV